MQKQYAKIAFNLHFKAQRSFVTIFMPLIFSTTLFCQVPVRSDTILRTDSLYRPDISFRPDTVQGTDTLFSREIIFPRDTLVSDSALTISPDAVDKPIVYNAEGYMKTDLKTKKVSLVDGAKVTYGTLELTADSIVLDMETGSVYATGRIRFYRQDGWQTSV